MWIRNEIGKESEQIAVDEIVETVKNVQLSSSRRFSLLTESLSLFLEEMAAALPGKCLFNTFCLTGCQKFKPTVRSDLFALVFFHVQLFHSLFCFCQPVEPETCKVWFTALVSFFFTRSHLFFSFVVMKVVFMNRCPPRVAILTSPFSLSSCLPFLISVSVSSSPLLYLLTSLSSVTLFFCPFCLPILSEQHLHHLWLQQKSHHLLWSPPILLQLLLLLWMTLFLLVILSFLVTCQLSSLSLLRYHHHQSHPVQKHHQTLLFLIVCFRL